MLLYFANSGFYDGNTVSRFQTRLTFIQCGYRCIIFFSNEENEDDFMAMLLKV